MSRRALPRDRIVVRYEPGPPKRIALTVIRVEGARERLALSTADARAFASLLWDAIEIAEADKVALRAAGAAPRKPNRARRMEQTAQHLGAALHELDAARAALAELAEKLPSPSPPQEAVK